MGKFLYECYLSSNQSPLLTMTYEKVKSPPTNAYQYIDPSLPGFGSRIFVLPEELLLSPEPDSNFPPEISSLDAVGKSCVALFLDMGWMPWSIDSINPPRWKKKNHCIPIENLLALGARTSWGLGDVALLLACRCE